jgi:N-formylglutamate deformylase
MRDAWSVGLSALPLVTTAIHAGHDLRPEIAARIALDASTRRREEDPFTDRITAAGGVPIVVHRSRFEVDLNRPRHRCVYEDPDAAWGLEVWRVPLTEEQIERSRRLHDAFYAQLAGILDDLALMGPFVVLDIHSYNHRRDGADRPPAPANENPEVNIGTGSLDRERWGHIVDRFAHDLGQQVVAGHHLEVAENVRFEGGYLCEWVHDRYEGTGCALAVELKKVFMDEWTGLVDEDHVADLAAAVESTLPALHERLASAP